MNIGRCDQSVHEPSWFSQYQHDAWGRRLTRDYKKMPRTMQLVFRVVHSLPRLCNILSGAAVFTAWVGALLMMLTSSLFGGAHLLSESPWMLPTLAAFGLALMLSAVPSLAHAAFYLWYESRRKCWARPPG